MSTRQLSTALICTALITCGTSPVSADHGRYRRLDDLAFAAGVDARELRWEVHDNFVDSRDYLLVLRDAQRLAAQIGQVTGTIWDERPDPIICRQIDAARNALTDLSRRLDNCDYAAFTPACHKPLPAGRGYTFAPATYHAGFVHVAAARQLMAQIDANLCAIHNELSGGHLVPYTPAPVIQENAPPVPLYAPGADARWRDRLNRSVTSTDVGFPWQHLPTSHGVERHPSHSLPDPAPVRDTSSPSRGIELPLFGGSSGGIVLRFDR